MGIVNSNVAIGHLDGTLTILKESGIVSLTVKTKNISPLVSRVFDIYHYKGNNFVGTPTSAYFIKNNTASALFKGKAIAVRQFAPSHDGNIWTLQYSLAVKYHLKTFDVLQAVTLKNRVDNLYEDSRGTLWLGAMDGIYTVDASAYNYLGELDDKYKNRAVWHCMDRHARRRSDPQKKEQSYTAHGKRRPGGKYVPLYLYRLNNSVGRHK
jgi:hypothetical protein